MKRFISILFALVLVLSFSLIPAMPVEANGETVIEVSQPIQVTSNSYYERGQSIVYDGTNYWLFYGRSAGNESWYQGTDPDVHDYQVYYKKATSVADLASATPTLISGVSHNANSYLGETGATYFDGKVWAFATVDPNPDPGTQGDQCALYGWYSSDDGTTWTQTEDLRNGRGLKDGQAHHDEITFDGKLWSVTGQNKFYTSYASVNPELVDSWSENLLVDDSINGGLVHFSVDGSDLYLAINSGHNNYIYKYNSTTPGWDVVDSLVEGTSGWDPTLFRVDSTYVFAQSPWVNEGGGRQYTIAWSSTTLDNIFDSASKMVTAGRYGTNTWTDMWPIGFTDQSNDSYLFYTSERDPAHPEQEMTGNIWYLPVDWTVTNDHYTYIQEAIDGASGTTINVAAGTYNESVTVNKALTLLGAKADVDPRAGAWTGDMTTIIGGEGNNGILITASDVTINGFKVTGSGTGGQVINSKSGIYVFNDTTELANIVIKYCWCDYNYGSGITLRDILNPTVEYCYLSNNDGEAGDDVSTGNIAGIAGQELTGGSISYNECANNDNYGIYLGKGGADIGRPYPKVTSGTTVSNNNLHHNAKYGIEIIGYRDSAANITVENNNIHDNGRDGLKIVEANDCIIDGNQFTNNGGGLLATKEEYRYGVYLESTYAGTSSSGNVFTNNTFSGNNLGGIYMHNTNGSLDNTVAHFNNFTEGSGKWGINNTSTFNVDATNNWWGDASGPSASPGTGDKVSANVDYDPYANGLRAYSGTPQTGTVGTALANPFVAQLKNSDGTNLAVPISGITATYAISTYPDGATGQSLSDTSPTTDSNGQASSTLTLGNKPGTYTVTANVPGESTATFTATATPGAPNTVTLTANPDELTADGSSTSTLTATVKDQYGNNVADGTDVVFEADHGTLGSSTVTKQTTDGVATATLASESSTETVIATITATANGAKGATSVFFIPAGGTGVEESKTKIVTGDGTVDATDTVTGMGDVDIDATGDHTVTTAKYEGNPGGTPTFQSSGNYYDVHLDDDTGVNSLTLNFCPATAGTVIYYWDGTSWVAASNQSYSGGCIVVTVTATTFPSLSDLSGLVFGLSAPAAPAGGVGEAAVFSPATSNLTITPAEGAIAGVRMGEIVTITTEVKNTGGRSGTYTVTLKINGVVKEEKTVDLAAYEKKTVTFTVIKEEAGTYKIEVNGLKGEFIVPELPAATFEVTNLGISPAKVKVGETVTISILVAETSGGSGSYDATLKINGTVVEKQEVALGPQQSQTVTFTIVEKEAGSYKVEVNGLVGEFTVEKPAPSPPAPAPPAKPINWWLIGGIIAAVVVVGLIIFFLVRRRAY